MQMHIALQPLVALIAGNIAAVRYSLTVNLQLQANILPMQHLPYAR